MIIKNVVQIGNPIFGRKCKIVSKIWSAEVRKIIKNLTDSMRHYGLVGMAAPQIGVGLRIFITEIRKTKYRKDTDKLRVFINPKIISASKKEVVIYEGCGSVAHSQLFAPVRRPMRVVVEAYNTEGAKFKLKADNLLSRVIQHEYDHLDGIAFTEKITDPRKIMSSEEYTKMIAKKRR